MGYYCELFDMSLALSFLSVLLRYQQNHSGLCCRTEAKKKELKPRPPTARAIFVHAGLHFMPFHLYHGLIYGKRSVWMHLGAWQLVLISMLKCFA